jgi:predicted unusual protein kinase regulating ubiquinone biosynthesis (AarF/ABC1/UbiB family)
MSEETGPGRAVPRGRLARLARFGALAGGMAGRVAAGGVQAALKGERPDPARLLLTPGNIRAITDELARLRGAAMKMGQLMSMDAGDFLPPELADIMARLRAGAEPMPPRQLKAQLDRAWGPGWLKGFERFDVRPIAAASIGQVHRGWLRDGRSVAVKVQYPGVRDSIASDVDNIATLVKLSGQVPAGMDIGGMLAEAKRQLHEEADYEREARCLSGFGTLLADDADYRVPGLHAGLSTAEVLTMDHEAGVAVETLATASQALRDEVMARLVRLVFRELFEFRLMQTDPNFANYRWNADTGRLVLLDFGATREVPLALAQGYHRLMRAGLDGDREAAGAAAMEIGLFAAHEGAAPARIMDLFEAVFAPVRAGAIFDFAATDISRMLREEGLEIARDRDFWHLPPTDTIFLQRKFAGLFLLGARLQARLAVRPLMEGWRDRVPV